MTASLFKITPTPPTAIALKPGEEGRLSFTIESLAAPGRVHEVMLQALRVDASGKSEEVDWLEVGPKRTLTISGGKTETAVITARPKSASPRGENRIKLVIADRDRPNDVYADSPPVSLEVKVPIEAPKKESKTPWWLIAAIAGGVLLLGGGVVLVWKLASGGPEVGGLGQPCRAEAAEVASCDDGLVCAGGTRTCLLAGGASCDAARAEDCASGECVASLGVCAIPRGGPCDPKDTSLRPATPCAGKLICNPRTRTCLPGLIRVPVGTLDLKARDQ